jgi:hypothetical protein
MFWYHFNVIIFVFYFVFTLNGALVSQQMDCFDSPFSLIVIELNGQVSSCFPNGQVTSRRDSIKKGKIKVSAEFFN